MFRFYRAALGVPMVSVADVECNLQSLKELSEQAARRDCAAVLFPELCLTGYTCGDLFFNSALLDASEKALSDFIRFSQGFDAMFFLGLPFRRNGRLFNATAVVRKGRLLGLVPKRHLPNYREFYEKRQFSSGLDVADETVSFAGQKDVPFGSGLLFSDGSGVVAALEICEDLWSVIPPSSHAALAGANWIFNPSAGDELIGKSQYRRDLVRTQSARCVAAYCYAGAGVTESTADCVFSGHCLAAENGALLLDSPRFRRENSLYFVDFDLERIDNSRIAETPFADAAEHAPKQAFRIVVMENPLPQSDGAFRKLERRPFVPTDRGERDARCEEIFSIQCAGLAKRMETARAKTAVVGVSGGLDSTLALLVCAKTMELLGRKPSDVVAVTMPGFGTTDRTYRNAVSLCRELGTTLREIPIRDACLEHFRSIGHEENVRDVVYENTQARERTQILFDLANQEQGLCVGTGDLSEAALGWCTFNGDHMSNYAVNCSVPKTLVRYVIEWTGEHASPAIRDNLRDIIDTPVSPELLPADQSGRITQKTEEVLGPYEAHDFFLYHFVKSGFAPEKLLHLACICFQGVYEKKQLERWLVVFLKRFFSMQFKRNCQPDGPKIGTIGLSPRGDWRMPPDASVSAWLKRMEES